MPLLLSKNSLKNCQHAMACAGGTQVVIVQGKERFPFCCSGGPAFVVLVLGKWLCVHYHGSDNLSTFGTHIKHIKLTK
ncbi:hypothetical protein POVCU2_0022340 [Plasmodium ovale curtisi]|uniref:Uncharacterized protein n=1 Tax=Plasmodium ovale curtisi TaxID=864141 RepID=A0A1A8VT91_PLAOA|nr:hypothetical protein POVCU2_0022340 [Plasmodium ovale curtisi]